MTHLRPPPSPTKHLHNPTHGPQPHVPPAADRVRLLVVLEGLNDVEFLRRLSRLLQLHDSSLPDLPLLEQTGEIVFLPFGGGGISAWGARLAPLCKPEFHLYDRELPPETQLRRSVVEGINRRPLCRALLTGKRSLENYLHPDALVAAGGVGVQFDDFDPVAELVAKRLYQRQPKGLAWELLPHRSRKRQTHRVKRWLNTQAADHMTVERLAARDPQGEVLGWLRSIGQLLGSH